MRTIDATLGAPGGIGTTTTSIRAFRPGMGVSDSTIPSLSPFRSPPGFSTALKPPPPCQQCVVLLRKLSELENKYYASSHDPNAKIAELETRVAASTADQDQLRIYLAEATFNANMMFERAHLDAFKLAEKGEVQVQMAYELSTTQDALRAASCRWESDNTRVTAQMAALRGEISDAQERSASAFT
eukprot:11759281-Heterocapsa_arctica.AAC.1